MLATVKDMHYSQVLEVLAQKRAAIAAELAELRAEGEDIIPIGADDLLLLERCGYMVDFFTGRILAGPKVLAL